MLIVIILITLVVVYVLRQHEKDRKKLSEMSDKEVEDCKSAYTHELNMNIGSGRTPVDYQFSEKASKYIRWSERDKFSAEFECRTFSIGILLTFLAYRFMSVDKIMEPDRYLLSLIISILGVFIAGWFAGTLAAQIVKLMKVWRGSGEFWFYCFIMSTGVVSLLILLYDYYQANEWRGIDNL